MVTIDGISLIIKTDGNASNLPIHPSFIINKHVCIYRKEYTLGGTLTLLLLSKRIIICKKWGYISVQEITVVIPKTLLLTL